MEEILLAVSGSLMRGLPLSKNLFAVDAEFVREATTSDQYRMWSINDQYPTMQRDAYRGKSMKDEVHQEAIDLGLPLDA